MVVLRRKTLAGRLAACHGICSLTTTPPAPLLICFLFVCLFEKERESKLVSWCFTPSQPVRLYQGQGRGGGGERERDRDRERQRQRDGGGGEGETENKKKKQQEKTNKDCSWNPLQVW